MASESQGPAASRRLDYLESEFQADRIELKQTRQLIERVANSFDQFLVKDSWPYEVVQDGDLTEPPEYSQSTNAMILFALAAAAGSVHRESLLMPAVDVREPVRFGKRWEAIQKAWIRLAEETVRRSADAGAVTRSGSFGNDDPFTMNWILELLRCDDLQERGDAAALHSAVTNRAKDRARTAFAVLPQIASALPGAGRLLELDAAKGALASDHAFVVLRYLQLARTVRPKDLRAMEAGLKRYFENRCYEQLSKNEVGDGEFDAAELVFALEGLLILEAQSASNALVGRIFQVLSEYQDRTPHWRPVKPLVTYPQGQVLFPLSVETAHSLLRCTSLIAAAGMDQGCFSRQVGTFKRYVAWLRSRIRKGLLKSGQDFEGWHSEHVHLHHGIHLWETSQVVLFLVSYAEMLDRHIARSALAAVELTERQPRRPIGVGPFAAFWDSHHRAGEPLAGLEAGSALRVLDRVGDGFVRSRDPERAAAFEKRYSMLLSGPPGTGKTNFAEELSRALNYPLIIVTPSDFVRGGESQVEERAKRLFDVLGAQSNVVILLDEIDRMILDRDAEAYELQSDIFQFMTPSMLTKLADLRKTKRVVFLVGTNYEEHIDPAAKRAGRLDERLMLPPPDFKGRVAILQRLIVGDRSDKSVAEFSREALEKLRPAAQVTALMVFSELKQLVEGARDDLGKDDRADLWKVADAVNTAALGSPPPAITLEAYRSRLTTSKYRQRPFLEFFVLLHIKGEDGGLLEPEELRLADFALQLLVGAKESEWSLLKPHEKADRARHALEKQVDDHRVVDTIVQRICT